MKRIRFLPRHSSLWPMLAIGAAIAGQYRLLAGDGLAAGLLYGLGGILMFWFARGLSPASGRLFPEARVDSAHRSQASWNLLPLLSSDRGIVAALLIAVLLAAYAWLQFDFETPSYAAWYAYSGALAVLFLSACSSAVQALRPTRLTRIFSLHVLSLRSISPRILMGSVAWHWAWGLAGILLLAGGLRVYDLDSLPFGTWYDEAANGLEALRIANEPNFRPVFNDGVNSSGHYLYLIVLFFEIFGVETESIRLLSAVMGLGAVAAAYGVGHLILGPGGGLIFASLLAVSRWAVNFSRVGMYNISTPFFALLALFFLIRGIRSGRLADYLAAGLAVGLGATFYSAYFLFLPVLALIVLLALVYGPQPHQRLAVGVGVLLVALAVLMAPTVKFALERPDNYFSRVRTTSLLEHTAPEERMAALARNAFQHVRMFHVRGDPNGRHNLPSRPMLDPVGGALMLLGLIICLARPRAPFSWVLLAWLAATLLPGVLSLDFESPQSLRSIGALPPAYLLATLPLWVMLRGAFAPGRRAIDQQILSLGVVLMVLGHVGYTDIRTYFVDQAQDFASWNAFSTPETLAARLLASTPGVAEGEVEARVISLYDGHPTLRFLAPEVSRYRRLETTDTLPILIPPERDILLIADAERQYFFEEAQALYPHARFEAIQPPFGGPTVLYAVYLTVEDQQSIQGARVRAFIDEDSGVNSGVDSGVDTEADANAAIEFPMPISSQLYTPTQGRWTFENLDSYASDVSGGDFRGIEWEGILHVPTYGPHWFQTKGAGRIVVFVGEQLVAESSVDARAEDEGLDGDEAPEPVQGIVLAQGPHALRIRAVDYPERSADEINGGEDASLRIYWRPPDRGWEQLPDWLIYHEPARPQGLLGHYFANGDWTPPEAFARIDGRWEMYFHVLPLPRPYTVEWRGTLMIPEDGVYGLGVQSTDESTLWIDGEQIAYSPGQGLADGERIELKAGPHAIRIRYADRTHHTNFRLFWEPPGNNGRSTIPAANLLPPQSDYIGVGLPNFALPIFEPGPVDIAAAEDDGLLMDPVGEPGISRYLRRQAEAAVEIVVEGLERPTSVAVGHHGTIWVAEPRAARVSGYSTGGELRIQLTGGEHEDFLEPHAVAVTPDGDLLVLDAEAGRIHRFASGGQWLDTLGVDAEMVMRSRGLAVDEAGIIWVAATSRGELVKLDAEGNLLGIIPQRAGGEIWQAAQPVGIAVNSAGHIWVTDPGVARLVSYSPEGRRLLAWDIPAANTLQGPQVAIHPQGFIVRSSPEEGELIGYAPASEIAVVWPLRSHDLPAVRPVGTAIAESGIIWVVDGEGGRLLRVAPEIPAGLNQD